MLGCVRGGESSGRGQVNQDASSVLSHSSAFAGRYLLIGHTGDEPPDQIGEAGQDLEDGSGNGAEKCAAEVGRSVGDERVEEAIVGSCVDCRHGECLEEG